MTPQAPSPGARRKQNAGNSRWKVTVGGKTLELPVAMEIGEKFAVRAATGFPLEAFVNDRQSSAGEDSVAVLWWLARRYNGEKRLSYAEAMSQWEPVEDADDVDLSIVTDDGEDTDEPGKSAPA